MAPQGIVSHRNMMLEMAMTGADDTKTLARPARAFEVDASWYESHWYTQCRTGRRKEIPRFTRLLVWAAIFVVGAYLVQ
jgi:hypothetical protein